MAEDGIYRIARVSNQDIQRDYINRAFRLIDGRLATLEAGEGGTGVDADTLQGHNGAYYLAWANFTGIPVYATRWPTFSEVTSKPTTLAGYGITDAQASDSDLTAIAGISGTGYLKRTGTSTWALDSGTGSVAWGGITGLLSNQTDLQTALNAKQTSDGDLTAIAAISGTGILRRVSTNTWSTGTLSVSDIPSLPASKINSGNFDVNRLGFSPSTGRYLVASGTSGSGTWVALDADLVAISALSGTGYLKRTGSSTWALDTSAGPGHLAGINDQAGKDYTLALTDVGKDVRCTNSSSVTLYVPKNFFVSFIVGDVILFSQGGSGTVTATGVSGVTVRSPNGNSTTAQYDARGLEYLGSDEWRVW